MEESNYQYELKTSRNGLSIPVINGIHLHSIYNPIKEAEAFVEGHAETLNNKSNILVLGLGFGYHIEQIAKWANKVHEDYKIIIIEPNTNLVEDFNNKRRFEDSNISIINATKAEDLFGNIEFINFLRNKPAIINHDTSYSLEKKFYSSFLKYQAPTHIDKYFHLLNSSAKEYFEGGLEDTNTFSSVVEDIKTKSGVTQKYDFAMLALEEMTRNHKVQGRGL